MNQETIDRIKNDPNYIKLTATRSRFAKTLTAIMLSIYFGFVLIIAFDPELFAIPLSKNAVTTVGIPAGLGVIFSAFILTGIYTRRANGEFDELTKKIKENAKGDL